jgi:murein L,D-transpeptidase YafK
MYRTRASLLLIAALAIAPVEPIARALRAEPVPAAERVLVVKSERRLYLLREGRSYKSYPVHLGLNPTGQKEREGDFRTPEGEYLLDERNARSEFFLSIHISYPSSEDAALAHRRGWSPGGSIMIHGEPNLPKHPAKFYRSADWTDGCIALANEDMLEIWLLTRRDTPIEIRP